MYEDIDFTITAIQHVIERLPDPNWKMDGILGPNLYVLGIALKGKAAYTINGCTHIVEEGDLILVPPRARRIARSFPEAPWHFVSIGCHIQFFSEAVKNCFEDLPLLFSQVPDSIRRKAKELSYIWNRQSHGKILLAKGLLYEIFHELFQTIANHQKSPRAYQQIMRAEAYIQENYAATIRQQDLAVLCGYSLSHFRRLFSEYMGMNCSQYILHFRIGVAKNLLLSGTATVSEAANLTGFSDVYHFSKIFKKVTGHAPSHFKP